MLILRRGISWLLETATAAILIGLWLRICLGAENSPEPRFWVQWWYFIQMTLSVFMLASGYLLTTAVCALSPMRSGPFWLYPLAIAILFSAHLCVFSGGWLSQIVVPIYIGGVTVVAATASIGNWAVRRSGIRDE